MQLICCDRKPISGLQEEGEVGKKRGLTKGPRQNFGDDSNVFFFFLNLDYCGGITVVFHLDY